MLVKKIQFYGQTKERKEGIWMNLIMKYFDKQSLCTSKKCYLGWSKDEKNKLRVNYFNKYQVVVFGACLCFSWFVGGVENKFKYYAYCFFYRSPHLDFQVSQVCTLVFLSSLHFDWFSLRSLCFNCLKS